MKKTFLVRRSDNGRSVYVCKLCIGKRGFCTTELRSLITHYTATHFSGDTHRAMQDRIRSVSEHRFADSLKGGQRQQRCAVAAPRPFVAPCRRDVNRPVRPSSSEMPSHPRKRMRPHHAQHRLLQTVARRA
eukprot:5830358-Amphidinium_carterae.1